MKSYNLPLAFLLSLILSCHIAIGQSLFPGSEDYTPPNPDVAAFVKYTESPVNLSNGSVQVSIPLYELKSKNLTMPVSISYHGSGIRTRQEASNVGLGWSHNTGGVISRTVLGLPDESPLGYNNSFPLVTPGVDSTFENAAINGYDLQPDIYDFNAMGYSGKFCLDHNQQNTVLLEDSEVRISRITGGGNNSWEILTPEGNKLIFDETEESFVNVGGGSNIVAITAWHLTEVYSPNNILEFELIYSEQSSSHSNNYFAGSKFDITADLSSTTNNCIGSQNIYCCEPDDSFSLTQGIESYKTFDSIKSSSDTYKLSFNYSSRSDLVGSVKLDSIVLLNKDDNAINRQNFFYSYFGPGSQRLRLDSLKKTSVTDSIPPYLFNYNDITVDKTSGGFDHWGYPNSNSATGQFPPSNLSELEQVFNGDQCFGFPARDPDSLSLEGMMTRIDFPTRGYEEYEWESHQFGAIRDTSDLVSPAYTIQGFTLSTSSSQSMVTSSNFDIAPEYPVIKLEIEAQSSSSCPFGIPCTALFEIYDASNDSIVVSELRRMDVTETLYFPIGSGTFYLKVSRDNGSTLHYAEATLTYHEMDMTQAV